MAVLSTTTCGRHGHPEIRISFEPFRVPVESDVRWLTSWLEDSVARGERFHPGQTCQIGWMVTQVRHSNADSLSLWEPDLREMPVVWTESVTNTLCHLRLQKDVVESVLSASDMSFPSMLQSALICTRLAQDESLIMERMAPAQSHDSGWFFGCQGEDHDHNDVAALQRVSLYEAAVLHAPQIIPYLALPAGVLLGTDELGGPAIFYNGEPLPFKAGSYLAARFPSQ